MRLHSGNGSEWVDPARTTRRAFLAAGSVAAAGAWISRAGLAQAGRALNPGLQLYSVRKLLATDYAGTLAKVAALGYKEVEAAGFYNHTAAQAKEAFRTAGLRCVSAHYALHGMMNDETGTLAFARDLGLEYLVCSAPYSPDAKKLQSYPGGEWQGIVHALTLDDWRWSAKQFNRLGALCKAQGLKFAYHNHTAEFRPGTGADAGKTGLDILFAETDPALVSLELDCGWVVAAGHDPVKILKEHGHRISMLHVKDLKPAAPGTSPDLRVSTVVGKGVIDYAPILRAARQAGVQHEFVEQEEFDGEPLVELAEDYRALGAISKRLG